MTTQYDPAKTTAKREDKPASSRLPHDARHQDCSSSSTRSIPLPPPPLTLQQLYHSGHEDRILVRRMPPDASDDPKGSLRRRRFSLFVNPKLLQAGEENSQLDHQLLQLSLTTDSAWWRVSPCRSTVPRSFSLHPHQFPLSQATQIPDAPPLSHHCERPSSLPPDRKSVV